MANPQHIEWLLEGVEKWNARREREDFVPDFADADIREVVAAAARRTQEMRVDLSGANLEQADVKRANLAGVKLVNANLAQADLTEAHLLSANLEGANLVMSFLSGAEIFQANLSNADLSSSDLRGAVLTGANANEASFNGADVRSVMHNASLSSIQFTDLSKLINLEQSQLDSMDGDSRTIIPFNLTRPAHWPEFDLLPDTLDREPYGDAVTLVDGRLAVSASALPSRDDLEQIFHDLTEDLRALKTSGNFGNISTLLHRAFDRFLRICDVPYGDMDQIRFGVQSKALRLQFDAARAELQDYAPDKSAALEAALLSAELISSRLPDWLEFLSETAPERPEMEAHQEEVEAELQDVAEKLEQHPEHFAPTLAARMREYVETKSMEAYFAAVGLLNNVAYTAFNGLRRAVKGVAKEFEADAYKVISKTIWAQIGGALVKLAGILPAELEWILPWLRYVEAMLK